jgi:hypothetical protein
MAAPNAITCAACGASGELHEHHLIPRSQGGIDLPTVMLCIPCHEAVHGRRFPVNHRELTIAGLRAAKARGVKLGNPNPIAGTRAAAAKAGQAASRNAERRAVGLMPHIARAREPTGYATLAEIAEKLSAWGIKTTGGSDVWNAEQVRRVVRLANRQMMNGDRGPL